jgi:hypothetical protein
MSRTKEKTFLLVAKGLFFLLVIVLVQGETAVVGNTHLSRNVAGLVDWIRSLPDGVVSDKLSIQENADTTSATSSSSAGNAFLTSNADIVKDETIMYIPKEALLVVEMARDSCQVLQIMLDEYDKGKESTFYPYIRFLFGSGEDDTDNGVRKVATTAWSSNGQKLLKTLVGLDLLPNEFRKSCTKACQRVCSTKGKDSERQQLEQDAFMMVMSRESNGLMIPCKFSYIIVWFSFYCKKMSPQKAYNYLSPTQSSNYLLIR